MKKIYLLNIEGANTANVKFSLEKNFEVVLIKKPEQISEEKPNIILPGNGSFGHYIAFLKKNNWAIKIESILNKEDEGKLFCICSGFQVLGKRSEESVEIEGLKLIDYAFERLNKNLKTDLVINIGRKEIFEFQGGLKVEETGIIHKQKIRKLMRPYFVHGYGAKFFPESNKINDKYCYLYTNINKEKFLAGIISKSFCATQFHPELSGGLWKEFMINFFR